MVTQHSDEDGVLSANKPQRGPLLFIYCVCVQTDAFSTAEFLRQATVQPVEPFDAQWFATNRL
jgi:hypothetical protein